MRYHSKLLLFLSLAAFMGCKDKKEQAQLVPEVNVVTAGQETVPVYSEYVGETYGKSDVEIQSRVQGWVEQLLFKEGSRVSQGQLLYVIQDDELRDKEQQAQANLSQQEVLLVRAKSELDRVKPLTEMNALSQRDLDMAQAGYDAQEQAVTAARAGLSNARTQLSYTRITAPIDGIIGISKVQVGDYVKNVGEGAINTISALGDIRVRFPITENDFLTFQRKMSASALQNLDIQFVLNDGSVLPETGRLDFANREVDPNTGSILIQAVVANKSHLLRPGQYVKVRFKSDELPNAVLVPQQAINQMQSIYTVSIVNDSNKISPRTVKTGPRVGSNWVITDGVKAGEKIALVGNAVIKPGMEIKPVIKPYSYDSTSTKK
jgi:membrane fusion protein, multidrug efflux system